ncbi:AP-4 complex subunit sigma-1-like [Anneissia japonica]|uniref:AP-4 complex subunit sigma-1-like n=1 Tax=Anneissia japonica TaxID=1529436 RepID=UPI001425B8A8|nr:AP-4 complex subunit sigma-1-like [Anneissia japonica]
MIKFCYILGKQGQTRLSRYYDNVPCKSRCSFFNYQDYKIVYRRYNSIFVILAIDEEENEVASLELIQLFIETLNKYFDGVSEIDIFYNLEKIHIILDEMIVNGYILETNMSKILQPILLMDKASKR